MASVANPNGRLILVVDDHPIILRSITAILAMAGYRVIVAENGAAGLQAFLDCPGEIDLVLADVVMPGMDGIEMSAQIKKHRPDAAIVLMSGYSQTVIEALHGEKFSLIRKPFLPDDLILLVKAKIIPPTA